jgi:3-oxoacyl-[acyl-carrier protein] reductase
MNIRERFKDKVAIITGGADGIGKGIARRMGMEGASVILLDRNRDLLNSTVADLEKSGIKVHGYKLEISSAMHVSQAILKIEKKWKHIDILIHSAGIVGPTSTRITEYLDSDFDMVSKVNLKGTFLITKYTLQAMQKRGKGRILLIASIAGKEGNPGMVGYSATKAGVIGLVKGVAKEYATTHITVNGLAPAVIKTPMNSSTSPEQLAYMTAKIPMQRLGTIEEVAAMACFIVSEENSFSTGFIYDISGGRATY